MDGGYRTTLAPLLPVSYYRLEVVVGEESGYRVVGQAENRRLVPFYSGTVFDETFFGSCLIGVERGT